MNEYLRHRGSLCCVFALIDSALPPQEIDLEFIEWLARNSVPFVLAFTKIDQVPAATVQANIEAFTAQISQWFEKLPDIFTCSAKTSAGKKELLGLIDEVIAETRLEAEEPPEEETPAAADSLEVSRPTRAGEAHRKRQNPGCPW